MKSIPKPGLWLIAAALITSQAYGVTTPHTVSGLPGDAGMQRLAENSRRLVPTGDPSTDREHKKDDSDAEQPKAYVRPQAKPLPGIPGKPVAPAVPVVAPAVGTN